MSMEGMYRRPSAYDQSRMDMAARMQHPAAAPDRLNKKSGKNLRMALALAGALGAGYTASEHKQDIENGAHTARFAARLAGDSLKRSLNNALAEARATLNGLPTATTATPQQVEAPKPAPATPHTERIEWRTWEQMSVADVEQAIVNHDFERMPLEAQITFFERMFQGNGEYARAFRDPNLTAETLTRIMQIANIFSTNLNKGYAEGKLIPGFEYLYNKETIKYFSNADFTINAECNGFIYRDIGDQVRFDTAAHCKPAIDGMGPWWQRNITYADREDVATIHIAPEDYERWNLTPYKLSQIPVMDPNLGIRDIAGKVVISYSYKPNTGKRKVYFGVAMPWTQPALNLALSKAVHHATKDLLFIHIPPEEVLRDPTGPKFNISGSSGSLVGLPDRGGPVKVVGSLVTNTNMMCSNNVCYGTAQFNTPEIHRNVMIKNMQEGKVQGFYQETE